MNITSKFLVSITLICSMITTKSTTNSTATPELDIDKAFISAVKNNNLKKMEDLIKEGADVNASISYIIGTFSDGYMMIKSSPLIFATRKNKPKMVKILLQVKNKLDTTLGQALNAAIVRGHSDIVEELIKEGADVNSITDKYTKETPLILAVNHALAFSKYSQDNNMRLNSQKIVKVLLEIPGIDLDHANVHGETARSLLEKLNTDVRSTTKNYSTMSADELKEALMKVIRENDVDSVPKILDQPESKNFGERNLRKALELAAKNNCIKIVHMLIQAGADVKHEYSNALKDAAEKGYIDVVKALLPVQGTDKRDYSNSFYMDINPFNGLRDAALIKAASNGHIDVVEELIQAGADVNYMNVFGERALVITAKNGHANVVKKLIQAGAKVNDFNRNGETALHWAVRLNHVDVARELLQVRGIDVDWFSKSRAQDQGGEMLKLFKPLS